MMLSDLAVSVIQGLSGFLTAALGIWVLTLRPRTTTTLAFGTFAIGYGAIWIIGNWASPLGWEGETRAPFTILAYVLWIAGIYAMCLHFPRRLTGREILGVWPAWVLAVVVFVARLITRSNPDLATLSGLVTILSAAANGGIYAYPLLLALRFPLTDGAPARRQLALTAAGTILYPAFGAGGQAMLLISADPGLLRPWATLVATGVIAAAWLLATRGPDGHLARRLSWATLALYLAGQLASANGLAGSVGVIRILAVAVLAYAIVHHSILGIDVKLRFAVSKSTIAAVFIAVFFIASETAQQFFGDTLGSTYVGIAAAGALVFAIAPLQRAAERLAERAVPVTTPTTGDLATIGDPVADRRAALYRRAVQFAIRDGRISPEEELHLFEVAHELGLGAGEAMRLRQEVEREARAGVA